MIGSEAVGHHGQTARVSMEEVSHCQQHMQGLWRVDSVSMKSKLVSRSCHKKGSEVSTDTRFFFFFKSRADLGMIIQLLCHSVPHILCNIGSFSGEALSWALVSTDCIPDIVLELQRRERGRTAVPPMGALLSGRQMTAENMTQDGRALLYVQSGQYWRRKHLPELTNLETSMYQFS